MWLRASILRYGELPTVASLKTGILQLCGYSSHLIKQGRIKVAGSNLNSCGQVFAIHSKVIF